MDEGDLRQASLPLQEEPEGLLHGAPQHVDQAHLLVVHHLHGTRHQAEATQRVRGNGDNQD